MGKYYGAPGSGQETAFVQGRASPQAVKGGKHGFPVIEIAVAAAVIVTGLFAFCKLTGVIGSQDADDAASTAPPAGMPDHVVYYSGRQAGSGDYFGQQTKAVWDDGVLKVYGLEFAADGTVSETLYLSGIVDGTAYETDYRLKYGKVYDQRQVSYMVDRDSHRLILMPEADAASGRYAVLWADVAEGCQSMDSHSIIRLPDGTYEIHEDTASLYGQLKRRQYAYTDGNTVVTFYMQSTSTAFITWKGRGAGGADDLVIRYEDGILSEVTGGDEHITRDGLYESYTCAYADGVLELVVYGRGDSNPKTYTMHEAGD